MPGRNGKVVFTRVVNGMGEVWIMKADGSGRVNLAGWSPRSLVTPQLIVLAT